MGIEPAGVIGGLDFHRAKHRMNHERGKTVVGVLKRDWQNVFFERASAETMWRRNGGARAFDVREQFRMWGERSDFERAFPGAHEILCRPFLAVGPTCIVAQVKRPDAIIV